VLVREKRREKTKCEKVKEKERDAKHITYDSFSECVKVIKWFTLKLILIPVETHTNYIHNYRCT